MKGILAEADELASRKGSYLPSEDPRIEALALVMESRLELGIELADDLITIIEEAMKTGVTNDVLAKADVALESWRRRQQQIKGG